MEEAAAAQQGRNAPCPRAGSPLSPGDVQYLAYLAAASPCSVSVSLWDWFRVNPPLPASAAAAGTAHRLSDRPPNCAPNPPIHVVPHPAPCALQVFLTGRSEDARAQTAANLAEAGYGNLCSAPSGTAAAAAAGALSLSAAFDAATAPSRSSGADGSAGGPLRRRQLAQQQEATATAASGTGSSTSGLAAPCYEALLMRQVGDERLASVFKAEARAALTAGGAGGGHVIVGNIGDQYSDLVGEAAGAASFKLPNPVSGR